ncbi:MAG TPA: ATP-binding protein [Caulobacteraceae bacterium]|nr:ATP-binding protein [Caulobacteraceae bacterium]
MIALLTGGVLVAQLVTGVLVAVLPPPRPPIYHLNEVANALRGGPLAVSFGRRLDRRLVAAPPSEPPARPGDEQSRLDLATLVGQPEANVRFQDLGIAGSSRWVAAALSPWRPPRPGGRHLPGMRHAGLWRALPGWVRSACPGLSTEPRPVADPDRVVLGDFVAAVQRPQGGWVLVRPVSEGFPNDWERRVLLWFGLSLMLVLPPGFLFARRMTAPLRRFAAAAERFGKDPNAPSLVPGGPAEIGVAATAFNQMQTRLKRYVQDRTAMVGAISHDLRTPLARVRFRMERAPPELRAAVAADLTQMEEMISAVLSFIRGAGSPGAREPLDLLSVVECAVDDASATGAQASIVTEAHPIVDGDASALQRLFANLIDNAVRYGKAARVSLRRADGGAVVEIADDGPGLPPEDLGRVFEPFYRAERARTLNGGGIGLGLAIARSIAREHGGDVRLINAQRGLVALVELPERVASR